MTSAAVAFVDAIQNRVLLTLDTDISSHLVKRIAEQLSRDNHTVVQIFLYDERVLTVSAA
jgi:RNase H-fold protein (predicted Holliday junction resolvase)